MRHEEVCFFLETLRYLKRRYSHLNDKRLSNYQLLKLNPKLSSITVCVTIAVIISIIPSTGVFWAGKNKRFGSLKDKACFLCDKHYKILVADL